MLGQQASQLGTIPLLGVRQGLARGAPADMQFSGNSMRREPPRGPLLGLMPMLTNGLFFTAAISRTCELLSEQCSGRLGLPVPLILHIYAGMATHGC